MSSEFATPIMRFGPHDRAISVKEAARITSLSVPEIDRRARCGGDFPRPLKISQKRRAFLLSDIQLWLASKVDVGATVEAGR